MIDGEAIQSGAQPRCPDCGTMPAIQVLSSMAGYYIGTECECGPYSRESGYYRSRFAAESAFREGSYGRA